MAKRAGAGGLWASLLRRATPERRREVYAGITSMSTPARSFYAMVAISTIIAAYGLIEDSTAVVIGAMLVAPLMGPIFGIALAITAGDSVLLRKAALSEVMGVVLAVALAALIGLVSFQLGFNSEILSRTQPTIYYIIIALASGLAGAYALVDERLSPALPGVAVATAVLPPLATCGLCLSAGRWDWAMGAFLLFFANFLAIGLAGALVFFALGMSREGRKGALTIGGFLRRFGLSFVLLAAIAVFMTHTLMQIVADRRLAAKIESSVSDQVRATLGAQVSEVRHERRGRVLEVVAVVLTPQEFGSFQVGAIERSLQQALGEPVRLVLRCVLSKDMDPNGPVFITDEERLQRVAAAQETNFLASANSVLRKQIADLPGASLVEVSCDSARANATVTAVVRTPSAIEPSRVAQLEQGLREATRENVHLVVRSILSRDADSAGYLYQPKEERQPPTGRELLLHERLQGALQRQLGSAVPGASLVEFDFKEQGRRLRVLAVARTPRNFEPEDVARVEEAFRKYVSPGTDLVVRSVVGTDTGPSGYLPAPSPLAPPQPQSAATSPP